MYLGVRWCDVCNLFSAKNMFIYIYIYIYIERERERERDQNDQILTFVQAW